jgi:hypothetical protein
MDLPADQVDNLTENENSQGWIYVRFSVCAERKCASMLLVILMKGIEYLFSFPIISHKYLVK